MPNKLELADVIGRFGKDYVKQYHPSGQQLKVLTDIALCRTYELGGHEEECDCCSQVRYSYNSCGNRHCPKCLATKQALWVDKLIDNTLPVKHYHIIFTVPHELNGVCLFDPQLYYKALFCATWRTLHAFGYTHYGVESGAVCILHSWGQNLSLHPHIHCIVPAVGYTLRGDWKHIGIYDDFLYPVQQLSSTFKGKFQDSLKRRLRKTGMLDEFNVSIQKAWNKSWVVHCQRSMAKADHVIRYLGQYTHRVAISNDRILDMNDTHVTFIAKDYRNRAQMKPVKLTGVEFLRRFCLHILPKRFVKIRRYGIYNHTTKRNLQLQFKPKVPVEEIALEQERKKETSQQRIKRLTGFDIGKCPKCKKGRMHIVRELPRIRSPSQPIRQLMLAILQ